MRLFLGLVGMFATAFLSISTQAVVLSNGAVIDPMTINPAEVAYQQAFVHKLFPYAQEDEPFYAQAHGSFSDADFQKLSQGASDDYFHDMDYGITNPQNQDQLQATLSPYIPGITKQDAVKRAARGRNNWIVWTGGNDRFWNYMARATLGGLDFLKTISDEPSLPSTRKDRWQKLGLVNEPCYTQATGPDPKRWGLWLPQRVPASKECPEYTYTYFIGNKRIVQNIGDPFAHQGNYPGVKVGARGTAWTDAKGQEQFFDTGSSYGYSSGIIGLRYFPNPDFDQKAASKWDPKRYYSDPGYFNDPNLIRPYRVGMACAFCHVGPSPTNPPIDFNNPKWANLNSNPGAQYYWVDRVFIWNWAKSQDSFIEQLIRTSRPGTLDTSIISSDQINNPRTMNAVYNLPDRIALAAKFNFSEQLTGDELGNAQFSLLGEQAVPGTSPLRSLYSLSKGVVLSPRVLKDGSDAVGALGALNRVYVNIGLFGEEWVQDFIPLIGGPLITPFRIDVAQKKSLYWRANVTQTPDLALFLLAATRPDKLAAAPGGTKYLKDFESPDVNLGKKVFARNCAQCHSSKLPEKSYGFFNKGAGDLSCASSGYLNCWNNYWDYTKTEEFKSEMEKIVAQPDFLSHNFMSTDLRVPANLIDDQLCSPVATNAIKGDVWDNFSSTTYKNLTPIGQFRSNFPGANPGQMESAMMTVPGGGRGYLRPPSLVSVWSTAPFLGNNSVGNFDWRGTVEGRMSSFDDSIHKLLNPETRAKDLGPGEQAVQYQTTFGDTLTGIMDVTSVDSYLKVPKGYLPNFIFNQIKKVLDANPQQASSMLVKGPEYAVVEFNRDPNANVAVKAPEKKNVFQRFMASITGERDIASEAADYPANETADMLMLGPIPAGVPVDLISNIDLKQSQFLLGKAITALVSAIIDVRQGHTNGMSPKDYVMSKARLPLLAVSKCNDFVVNRGHYFGTKYSKDNKLAGNPGMSDQEKKL